MIKPPSIARFEQFYWASVILGLINTALNWKTSQALIAANPVLAGASWIVPVTQVIGLLIAVLLWFFIVRRPSVVAKWIQVVFAALGAFGIASALFMLAMGRVPVTIQVVLGLVANILYIAAAVMLFKPDAKEWLGEGRDPDDIEAPRVMIGRLLLAATAIAVPAAAQAQSYRCSAPTQIDRPRPDLADARQPQRLLPIGGYTLAITWAPQFCHEHARDASARFQCGSGNRFGFTLHGLWPDGVGKDWPQYCQATPLLSREVIQRNICSTPSAQLLQHEWSKHGTCMSGYTPERYFAQSTGLYAKLRYPDMNALSRRPLTAGKLAQAVADANPGLTADMMRITANRRGWLDEIWLCLDKTFRYQRCPAHQGGLAPNASVKIWRGMR